MSSHVGDFATASTVRVFFNTHQTDGTPITLAGTPVVSVYKDGSTTESTTGVTLTVDFDSRTGLHLVAVDTSADGSFYSAGSDFRLVLTAGTVDSVSVVGTVVGAFSLANRSALRPATAGRTLAVDASGRALADVDTIKTQTVTCAAGVTVLASVGTAATSTAQTGDSFARIGSAGAGLTAIGDIRLANLDAAVSSRLAPTVSGRTLDVSAGGEAGIDWANVGSPTTTLVLSGTTIGVATDVTTKTGYSLASGGLDAITVESSVNARQALSGILAACAGAVSGAGTGTITIKGGGVATTRVVATTDSNGNRSAVTLTLPS